MSIEIMNLVWKQSKSTGRARLVLLAIADHQGEMGAWPSIETLARMVNSSPRSVKRDIQELINLGELVVQVQNAPTKTQYKTNLYWVTISGVTNEVAGVTELTSGVTDGVIRGDTVGTQNLNITLNEPLSNYAQTEFEQFWNVYPRKVGKDDAKAALVKALKRESFDIILAGVIRFAHDPNKPSKEFLPYPATWLNRGSWDDEPYPERNITPAVNAEMQVAISKQKLDRDRELTKQMLEEQRKAAENIEVTRCVHNRIIFNCPDCR
jgi:hypothetical protein